jgi:hypothetical protein
LPGNFQEKKNRRNKAMKIKFIAILGLGILAATAAKADDLYVQTGVGASSGEAYESELNGDRVFDDFTLTVGGTINTVDWSGVDFNTTTNDSVSDGFTAYPFTINFYSDNNGQAGQIIASGTFNNDAGETSSGSVNEDGYTINNYSENLYNPFVATAGTEYFISIVASNAAGDEWGWEDPQGPELPDTGAYWDNSLGVDLGSVPPLTFDLEGNPVSTPDSGTTAPLLGLAFIGLGFARQRFRLSRHAPG